MPCRRARTASPPTASGWASTTLTTYTLRPPLWTASTPRKPGRPFGSDALRTPIATGLGRVFSQIARFVRQVRVARAACSAWRPSPPPGTTPISAASTAAWSGAASRCNTDTHLALDSSIAAMRSLLDVNVLAKGAPLESVAALDDASRHLHEAIALRTFELRFHRDVEHFAAVESRHRGRPRTRVVLRPRHGAIVAGDG